MSHAGTDTSADEATKRDFRQEVTDNIVALLEKGVAPWQKPWDSQAHSAIPTNPTTDKPYRGGNAVHLLAVGLQKGYEDPRWMTYKQAAEQGWQVRKGEKGTQIEFWDVKPQSTKTGTPEENPRPTESENQPEHRLIHRIYTVFNARQIDGIPAYTPRLAKPFEVVEAGEQILNNSGARISHDQADRAFYNRGSDSIHLPPKHAFTDPPSYYGTALHELAHWSGHPDRLNRSTLTDSYRFGDQNYAKEELRAELASVFIAAEKGIPHHPESHAAYVGSWIQALQQDKHEIFRAAHDASKATDFILSLERDTSIADEALGNATQRADAGSTAAKLRQGIASLDRGRDQIGEAPLNTEAQPEPQPLGEAESITARHLGPSARTYLAQTNRGIYRGTVIGETPDLFVQRLSPKSAIAHSKDLFDQPPGVGATVSVNYQNAKPVVREIRERAKSQELSR